MNVQPASSGERQRADLKRHLPRLAPEFYRGHAFVHWTITIANRSTGWLTSDFHQTWQLTLLHACARYDLLCPAYTLMPDHAHILLVGLDDQSSDQRLAIEFLRKHLRAAIAPADWQKQAHDHVLRESEREQGAFQSVAHYIVENPVRAKLASDWKSYPYLGCCVPGYPEFDVRKSDYWQRFWRCHRYLIARFS